MNKRILTFFVAFLLLFSMALTSCGETVSTSSEMTESSTNEPTTENDPYANVPTVESAETVGIMSFNLRYDVTSHAVMKLDIRGPHLMEIIDKYDPDSVGFNEATNNWMYWLRGNMKNRGYAYVGVGGDTGVDNVDSKSNNNGYNPVFYKEDKYELLESDTFWLSETPDVPKSKGWGSGYTRICTYAVLKNKTTGESYAHFNAHLDHKDMEAQENAVYVIETYMREILKKYGDIGIVLSGDFNAHAFEDDTPGFDPFTYDGVTSYLDDARYIAKETGVISKTYIAYNPTTWKGSAVDASVSPIDYIFLKKGAYECSYYTVVADSFTFEADGKTWQDHPVSDHYGVFAKIRCTRPAMPFIKDESKLIDHKATVSTTVPDGLLPECASQITVTSNFDATNDKNAITNLLRNDDSNTTVYVAGNEHGYWEITLSLKDLDTNFRFNGLSVKTASSNSPFNMRVFVSIDGITWEQLGGAYAEKLAANTTYYVKSDEILEKQCIRLVFSDTASFSKLNNVTVYGEAVNNGRISPKRITVTDGPNYKHSGGEGCENLFDGTTQAKFYFAQYDKNKVPATPDEMKAITFKTDTPVTVTHYNLVNANDTASYKGRLPRCWTLYGSTDGKSWTVIDTQTSPVLSELNYAANSFAVSDPSAYQYYKLVFVCGTDGNVQFSELELFEKIGS